MIIVDPFIKYLKISGITLYPFILIRNSSLKHNQSLLNHERIHLKQQLELLILPFYVIYLIEFAIRYIRLKDFKSAYLNISFEQEAYENDQNKDYLLSRKFYNWIIYL